MQDENALIRAFLAHTDTNADSAIPDNDLEISQPTANDGDAYPTVSIRSRVNHLHGNDKVRIFVPDDEVIELFRYKARNFLDLHTEHGRPYDPTKGIRAHLGGVCRHLRDQYGRILTEHFPGVEAHVHSNAPHERLCLACIRQRRLAERYQCTTCGGRNPTLSRLRRRSAVETTSVPVSPLIWHVPMCRRCRQVISCAYHSTAQSEQVSA